MILYAESSAVLAWLLEEPTGERIGGHLAEADLIVTSQLTRIECDRVLIRALRLNELAEHDFTERTARLESVWAHWSFLALGEEVILGARRPFPVEPLRTLDAIHLASALVAREAVGEITFLSLDRRVRQNAKKLALPLFPTHESRQTE